MAITRRMFLQSSVAVAGVVGSACGSANQQDHQFPDEPSVPLQGNVAVVKPSTFGTHDAAVREVVRLSGGLGFIRPGQRVLLKPAVNSGNAYPATVDPETLLIMGTMVKEVGGEPYIADRSFFLSNTMENFEKVGIKDAAQQLGVPLLALESKGLVVLHHPLAKHWWGNVIPIYRDVATADHIINLCTPRTHSMGDITMAMKNAVGVVDGPARSAMHAGSGFKQRLAEISLVVKPSFILMDGRQGFTNGGPDGGDLAHPDFLAAGTDLLAMDAVGIAFLRQQGANAVITNGSLWELPMMKRGAQIGLGVTTSGAVRLTGMTAEEEAALRAVMT